MSSNQDAVSNEAVQHVLLDLNNDEACQAAASGASGTQVAALLYPHVKEAVSSLENSKQKLADIDEKFFEGRRSFVQQFGLMMFPSFTFFDSLMERFAIELTQNMGRGPILGFISMLNPKDSEKKVAQAYQNFAKAMQDQLAGMEHEGAEPFVSQLSLFLENIDEIPIVCENAAKEKNTFLFKIRDAHRQLFLSEGEDWEDTAMTAMGDVLGRLALSAMPTEKHFLSSLKKIRPANAKKQAEKFIVVQRKLFQDSFVQLCQPIYLETIHAITAAWQEYKKLYECRLISFKNFLQNFVP